MNDPLARLRAETYFMSLPGGPMKSDDAIASVRVGDLRETLARIEALTSALDKQSRCLLPVHMGLAQAECVDEPIPDSAVVLSFMGSGASDQVTAGEVREALDAARTALTPSTKENPQ